MKNDSVVDFATQARLHIGFAVNDLEQSVAYYRTLFGQVPTKTRPHYAKFEIAEPPVNLALNEVDGKIAPNHPVAHYGIQVKSTDAVHAMTKRLKDAGLETTIEESVSCCYAVQNKVWATDPDGNKWEIFVVLDNDDPHYKSSKNAFCANPGVVTTALEV